MRVNAIDAIRKTLVYRKIKDKVRDGTNWGWSSWIFDDSEFSEMEIMKLLWLIGGFLFFNSYFLYTHCRCHAHEICVHVCYPSNFNFIDLFIILVVQVQNCIIGHNRFLSYQFLRIFNCLFRTKLTQKVRKYDFLRTCSVHTIYSFRRMAHSTLHKMENRCIDWNK